MFSQMHSWSTEILYPILADMTVKGSLIILLAAVIALYLRRHSAALRHLIWTFSLASFIVLPVLTVMLPRCTISVPVPWKHQPLVNKAEQPQSAANQLAELPGAASDRPPMALPKEPENVSNTTMSVSDPAAPATRKLNNTTPAQTAIGSQTAESMPQAQRLEEWIPWIYLAGVLLFVARLGLGWLSLIRLRRRSVIVSDGWLWEVLADVRSSLGITRPVKLCLSDDRSMPMTWGMVMPIVLLPKVAEQWNPAQLRMVLIHELTHVQRQDCLWQFMTYLVRSVHWFNPLVWFASNRMHLEQERACDDAVIRHGFKPSSFAEHLVRLVTTLRVKRLAPPLALGITRSRKLQRRVVALLDNKCCRVPFRLWLLPTMLLAAFCGLLTLAPLQIKLVSAGQKNVLSSVDQKVDPLPSDFEVQLSELRKMILDRYVVKVDENKLTADVLDAVMKSLGDPYSSYIDEMTLAEFQMQLKGKLAGIGIQIKLEGDELRVMTPLENSPALKAGIQPGDVILEIDDKSIAGFSIHKSVELLRGPKGSKVKLRILRPDGKKKEITVTRDSIKIANVRGFVRGENGGWQYLLDGKNKIGYLQIMQFAEGTADELKKAVNALQKKGMKGLIIDLRFCPGGLMNEAIGVADLFLDKGTIISIKGQDKKEKSWKAMEKGTFAKVPLVVLINSFTASSGEIVAGAWQDNERAILLGMRTYGKGSVQSLIALKKGGALKMTTAYHYLPSGRNIQKKPGKLSWGVDPNDGYYLPMTHKEMIDMRKKATDRIVLHPKKPRKAKDFTPKLVNEQYSDPQLAAAMRTLEAKINQGDFLKVGKGKQALLDQVKRLEDLRKEQDSMQRELEQVHQQITELENVLGKEK